MSNIDIFGFRAHSSQYTQEQSSETLFYLFIYGRPTFG